MPDINIMRIDPITRRVTWGWNVLPARNYGIELLVQLCAKTILTTSGQDYLRPECGGNILSLSGRSLNSDDIPRLKADIAYIIKSSEEQILREQVDKVIPADDRLRKITLLSIDIDLSEGTVDIRVLVENESGRASKFNFEASVRV